MAPENALGLLAGEWEGEETVATTRWARVDRHVAGFPRGSISAVACC